MSDNENVYPKFIVIPGGEFLLGAIPGDDEAHDDEKPRAKVYIDEFQMGKYPVTNEQYRVFLEATGHKKPRFWDDPQFNGPEPVVGVSWHDAQAYCAWLSKATGRSIRLPTEAEWEKAAGGGTEPKYYWKGVMDSAWFEDNAGGHTHPVGCKQPNDYGLYDMLGNVWEWVEDWYNAGWYKQLISGVRNPVNTSAGCGNRVLRGGSWFDLARDLRVSSRYDCDPTGLYRNYGFRCAQTLSGK